MVKEKAQLVEEDLEGYYEVVANIVKVVKDPKEKIKGNDYPILFRGDKVHCDGKYDEANGTKYLSVEGKDSQGFVPEGSLKKL